MAPTNGAGDAPPAAGMWAWGFGLMLSACLLLSYAAHDNDKRRAASAATVSSSAANDKPAGPTTRLIPSASTQASLDRRYLAFRNNYLTVYLCVMAGDWLQGPYVYALYKSYGYGLDEIGLLFIVGFLSSALFGTVISSTADTVGRKKMCLLFSVVYICACLTKLSSHFHVLMLGRLLGGISTSLLFSVFEAWMVNAHNARGFSSEQLSATFSWATFGNGVVAILCGILSNIAVDLTESFVAPFMLAIGFLAAGGFLVASSWTENYGQNNAQPTGDEKGTENNHINRGNSLMRGLRAIMLDRKVLCVGLAVSLFEGAMYTFVFMWGPVLEQAVGNDQIDAIPFGLIFATFMVCIMVGSVLFRMSMAAQWSVEKTLQPLLLVAALSLFLPVLFKTEAAVVFWAFNLFEVCCGMYFPVAGTMRGKYVPEETRATVMNLFRVPLNLIVVVTLTRVSVWSNEFIFGVCGTLVLVGYAAAVVLARTAQ